MADKELIMFILAQLATAAAVYGAIRADLREALTRCAMLEQRVKRFEDWLEPATFASRSNTKP